MAAETSSSRSTVDVVSDREFVYTRVFDAPRELVFRAFTDPDLIPRWWGPRSLTTTVDRLEARPGGVWRFVQRDAEGNVHGFNGVFHEVVPPERIVQTFEYEGAPGRVHLETATFEDLGSKTKLTSRALFPSAEDMNAMLQSDMESGLKETLERLTELVASLASSGATADREIVLTRTFDAPRELVFAAYTDPRQIERWWGPNGFSTSIHEMNVRPGGVWRFTMHGPDGTDYPNKVVYEQIAPPERLVYVHGSGDDDAEDERFHVTITLVERDGKTELTQRMVFATSAERDRVVGFGAIELGQQTLAHLAEHLARQSDGPAMAG